MHPQIESRRLAGEETALLNSDMALKNGRLIRDVTMVGRFTYGSSFSGKSTT